MGCTACRRNSCSNAVVQSSASDNSADCYGADASAHANCTRCKFANRRAITSFDPKRHAEANLDGDACGYVDDQVVALTPTLAPSPVIGVAIPTVMPTPTPVLTVTLTPTPGPSASRTITPTAMPTITPSATPTPLGELPVAPFGAMDVQPTTLTFAADPGVPKPDMTSGMVVIHLATNAAHGFVLRLVSDAMRSSTALTGATHVPQLHVRHPDGAPSRSWMSASSARAVSSWPTRLTRCLNGKYSSSDCS